VAHWRHGDTNASIQKPRTVLPRSPGLLAFSGRNAAGPGSGYWIPVVLWGEPAAGEGYRIPPSRLTRAPLAREPQSGPRSQDRSPEGRWPIVRLHAQAAYC